MSGKQNLLENTLKAIEGEVTHMREEISVLKKALDDTTEELKQKKLD